MLTILCALSADAQLNRYLVQFTDKAGSSFSLSNPAEYLSQRAIDRRLRYNISIDSTDLPVNSRYLDSVRLSGDVTMLNISKWLNQVSISTTDTAAIARIAAFTFVKSMEAIASFTSAANAGSNKFETIQESSALAPPPMQENLTQYYNYGLSNGQVKIHKGDFLHNLGFRGEGMQMAIIDAGFFNYLSLPTFDSIRTNNQVLGTWDFVDNEDSVNDDDPHGMQCLSTIAANMPGTFIGTAPKTSFYLYRSEESDTEYPIEEHNYAAALERADSIGADVTSTSLGYTTFDVPSLNHSYADMNGNTTIAARAADYAARKGMLMVVAAGNEGQSSWHFLSTPSDADSVLSVGAVDTLGTVAGFSGYGPSSDGQVKPGVAAVGRQAVIANGSTGMPGYGNGTSFACPNMAGLSTCLWQAFPEVSNMEIISALQESASKFTTPDDRVGYGIPDLKKAFVILVKRLYTQTIQQAGCSAAIKFTVKSASNMMFDIQRKLPADADFVTINSISASGSFQQRNYAYNDDLSLVAVPSSIQYRIRMSVDTDTSFIFAPVTISHNLPCATYTFTGNGNWNTASNWQGNLVPPATLPAGSSIIIDPIAGGQCILNVSQEVAQGALFVVQPGKQLLLTGNLVIQP